MSAPSVPGSPLASVSSVAAAQAQRSFVICSDFETDDMLAIVVLATYAAAHNIAVAALSLDVNSAETDADRLVMESNRRLSAIHFLRLLAEDVKTAPACRNTVLLFNESKSGHKAYPDVLAHEVVRDLTPVLASTPASPALASTPASPPATPLASASTHGVFAVGADSTTVVTSTQSVADLLAAHSEPIDLFVLRPFLDLLSTPVLDLHGGNFYMYGGWNVGCVTRFTPLAEVETWLNAQRPRYFHAKMAFGDTAPTTISPFNAPDVLEAIRVQAASRPLIQAVVAFGRAWDASLIKTLRKTSDADALRAQLAATQAIPGAFQFLMGDVGVAVAYVSGWFTSPVERLVLHPVVVECVPSEASEASASKPLSAATVPRGDVLEYGRRLVAIL